MTQESSNASSSRYREAGVDIDAANRLIDLIRPEVKTTFNKHVLGGLGGFAGLFQLDLSRYPNPVLVAGTDGVGTKLKLAHLLNRHRDIGIDLVAMCVNDLIVTGADPLLFLDYYATGRLHPEQAAEVISGICEGCRQAGAVLLGGETAEMPGFYGDAEYDLAGFCVGAVNRDALIDGQTIAPGDRLIGVASSGIHANGYSLVRKLIQDHSIDLQRPFGDSTLGDVLLTPTRIYAQSLRALRHTVTVKGIAHITGGGITENLPRILPPQVTATINTYAWPRPEIFTWLQQCGSIPEAEMLRTFNCGIGIIVCVAEADEPAALDQLKTQGETAWSIGDIHAAEHTDSGEAVRFVSTTP